MVDAGGTAGEGPAGRPVDGELLPREDVIAGWRREGYTLELQVAEGGRIYCPSCDETHEPSAFHVEHTGRHEGVSNPGDEQLMLAIICRRCGIRGTLTLGYGTYADADEAEVARQLA